MVFLFIVLMQQNPIQMIVDDRNIIWRLFINIYNIYSHIGMYNSNMNLIRTIMISGIQFPHQFIHSICNVYNLTNAQMGRWNCIHRLLRLFAKTPMFYLYVDIFSFLRTFSLIFTWTHLLHKMLTIKSNIEIYTSYMYLSLKRMRQYVWNC